MLGVYRKLRGFFIVKLKLILMLYEKIFRSLYVNKAQFYTIKYNYKKWRTWRQKNSATEILCDLTSIGEATIAISYFSNVLARREKAKIIPFAQSYSSWALSIWLIYKSFNANGIIYCLNLNQAQKNKRNTIYSELKKTIRTKQDLIEFKVEGVLIGIDIYETYLRNYSKATIDLEDHLFWKTFKNGIGILIYWQDYFKKHKIAGVIVSHDCYISMNIVCKVAYSKKIPVYSPTIRGIFRLDAPFMAHKYFSKYPDIFRTLSHTDQLEGLEWAKERLKLKFSGEVGVDMSYSTKTGYKKIFNDKKLLRESANIKILIASHCFFDNPHAYDKFIFADFHEWLHFLGGLSKITNYDWYLKSHPDPLPGTFESLNRILKFYPNIVLLPHETSHHQLIKEGINVVLTAHGTIGHEYPYFDIPVINAAYNPHIAYNFNYHAKTIEEYKKLILNLNNLKCKIVKQEILEFYFMHYKYSIPDDLMLPSYSKYLNEMSSQKRVGFEGSVYFINNMDEYRHEEIIFKLDKYLNSGKNWYFSSGPI